MVLYRRFVQFFPFLGIVFYSHPLFANCDGLVEAILKKDGAKIEAELRKKTLGFGINVNCESKGGLTPLMAAVDANDQGLVNNLIGRGANVDKASKSKGPFGGSNPLWLAAEKSSSDMLDLLLKKGAKVDYVHPKYKSTALHMSSMNGNLPIVEVLVKHHANVDFVESSDGTSALYMAAQNGHNGVVQFLIKNKAKPNITDKSGMTPLVAAERRREEIPDFNGIASLLLHSGGIQCLICQMPVENGEQVAATACSHASHGACMDEHIKHRKNIQFDPDNDDHRKPFCPNCNATLGENSLTKFVFKLPRDPRLDTERLSKDVHVHGHDERPLPQNLSPTTFSELGR